MRPSSNPVRPINWVPAACLLAVLIVLAAAGVTWNDSPSWGHGAHAQSPTVGTVPEAAAKVPATAAPLSPTRVEIPALHATAPIVSVQTDPDGELQIPEKPTVVGWWSPGAKPGAARGTAVLAGHINYRGVTGTFSDIGKLEPGDQVRVYGTHNADGKTEVTFSVSGVRTYHKTHLPYQQIFDQKVAGRLALITCGGPFDASTGNYLDNIVVYAVPVSSR